MEKFKDFLYDMSDIIISLLIIAVIFVVISWKLNDTITIQKPTVTEVSSEQSNDTIDIDLSNEPIEDITDTTDKPIESNPDTEEPVEEEPIVIEPILVEVIFEVPGGSTGYDIARSLQANGLIDDITDFLQVVTDNDLGTKMQSGEFKLNTSMDYLTIAKVLARKD